MALLNSWYGVMQSRFKESKGTGRECVSISNTQGQICHLFPSIMSHLCYYAFCQLFNGSEIDTWSELMLCIGEN